MFAARVDFPVRSSPTMVHLFGFWDRVRCIHEIGGGGWREGREDYLITFFFWSLVVVVDMEV